MAGYKKILSFLNVDPIINDLIAIVEAKVELLKIELKEEAAKLATKVISIVVLAVLVILIVLFFSFTVATLLNEIINSQFWGYAIVTGFYLLLLIAFKLFKVGDRLERKIEASLNNLKEDEEKEVEDG